MEKRGSPFIAPIVIGWSIGMVVCAMLLSAVASMKPHQTQYLLSSIPNQNLGFMEMQRSIVLLAWQGNRQELCIVGAGLLLPFLFVGMFYFVDKRRPLLFLQRRVVQVLIVLAGLGAVPVIFSDFSRLLPGFFPF